MARPRDKLTGHPSSFRLPFPEEGSGVCAPVRDSAREAFYSRLVAAESSLDLTLIRITHVSKSSLSSLMKLQVSMGVF